ncbi:hypothetical protein CU669_10120 [Paramagnetospirillum kuznetsovii]|uniref:Uncharacterized protein n=1 Tax=Paramagnetospirillum kuznetsovii TaxID=2053833 RepID=A0A364NY89_9PROT|nr:hypothetical protein [Paramagnetospirillum kuznetsovii]RAU22041.1 hypothetical protein CU669_10120 [Paramagnetospirillum kuznetsovii]
MVGFFKNLFGAKPPVKAPAKPTPKPIAKAAAAMGEDRAALLKQAQQVHRAKRKILDHLSDEDRAKLVGMAILTFLNDGREPDSKK